MSAPFDDLRTSVAAAHAAGIDTTPAILSTADADGRPSSRVVLVKDLTGETFHLFTNYHSRKARDLDQNPWAALVFHWPAVGRQVRIEGSAARTSGEVSDRYWATRPRDSQLGAWASEQSTPIPSRDALLGRFEQARVRFEGAPVPRPDHWGGFELTPHRIEFWSEGEHRLHDRFLYVRAADGAWLRERLAP